LCRLSTRVLFGFSDRGGDLLLGATAESSSEEYDCVATWRESLVRAGLPAAPYIIGPVDVGLVDDAVTPSRTASPLLRRGARPFSFDRSSAILAQAQEPESVG
jgi:hypothetical protein